MSIVANAYKLLLAQGVKDENLESVLFTHVSNSQLYLCGLILIEHSPKLWNCSKDNDNIKEAVFDTRPIFGVPSIFARRSRLHAELYRFATDPSRTGKPARVLTEVNIKSVDPSAGVVVSDTGETHVGDLIIGADGINSAVRGAVLAHSSIPNTETGSVIGISEGTAAVPTGLAGYASVVPAVVIASDPELAFQAVDGVAGICHWEEPGERKLRVLCYPCDNKEYFQVFAYIPETLWVEEFEKNKTSIIRGIPAERVLKDFESFHPVVKKLLRCVDSAVPYWSIILTIYVKSLAYIGSMEDPRHRAAGQLDCRKDHPHRRCRACHHPT
jgi:salicylate hydroxylase